jgi:hypothetical protein
MSTNRAFKEQSIQALVFYSANLPSEASFLPR